MTAGPITSAHIGEFERLALEATGVRLSSVARERVAGALTRLMTERSEADADRMLDQLRQPGSGTALTARLVGDLTTKETYLFRDPRQFDCLADSLIPELLGHARSAGRKLRIWCAGCATGEEAYSLAMLLAEAKIEDAVVLATDLSEAAVATARRGSATDMRLAPDAGRWAPVVQRWIRDSDSGPVVAPEVRALVRFATHNAVRDEPPMGQDLIMCRNVMIYLPPEGQRTLVDRLWDALLPDGLLLLGEAELLHVMKHGFQHVPCDRAIIYRKPKVT